MKIPGFLQFSFRKKQTIDHSEPTEKTIPGEVATRSNSIEDLFALIDYLPDPDPVIRKTGNTFPIYRELLIDDEVWSSTEKLKAGVLSMEWDIDRGKSKSRQAKVIKKAFEKIKVHDITNEILDCYLYGFQALEILWEVRDGMILPKAVVGKPQEWFVFGSENELRFLSKANPRTGEPVKMDNFLLARHKPSYKNPYGEKILSRVFWPVSFKKGVLKFWLKMAEKYGMPHVYAFLSQLDWADETKRRQVLEMLDKMAQDGVAVMPQGAQVNSLPVDRSSSTDTYDRFAEFLNKAIRKSILTVTTTTDVGKAGNNAVATQHGDEQYTIIVSLKRIVEETYNDLIEKIYRYNFPDGLEKPKFALYEEEEVDQALATRDKTLSDTGQIKFTQKYFKKAYGFEDDDFEMVAAPAPAPVPDPATQSFSEPVHAHEFTSADQFPDQSAIEELVKSIQVDPASVSSIVNPIMKLVNESNNYSEAVGKLGEVYPKMSSGQLLDVLERAVFISDVWGRLNAK